MGFLSSLLSSPVSSTVTAGQGGGGGGGGWQSQIIPQLVQQLIEQGKLPAPQRAAPVQVSNAVPPVQAPQEVPSALIAANALPYVGGGGGFGPIGGSSITATDYPQPGAQTTPPVPEGITALLEPIILNALSQGQLPQQDLQNLPSYMPQPYMPQPYVAPEVAVHRGGFVHPHFLPGERILR